MSLWLETNNVEEICEECIDGEYVVCDECDGTGDNDSWPGNICHKCWGEGKLDWIENIMGKEKPFQESSSTSSVSSSISTPTYYDNTPFENELKKYTKRMKGKQNEHNNSIRSRALQRFSKMFDKSKRRM